jgi:single-strand DNA-binding protein
MDRIKVSVTGRLTRNPEPKEFNGDKFTEITVAANQGSREQQDTLFFRARVYGKPGEIVAEHGFKGREVTVEGDLKFRTFDKQDGSKGHAHDIQYAQVNLHGLGRGGSGDYGSEMGDVDEMPF